MDNYGIKEYALANEHLEDYFLNKFILIFLLKFFLGIICLMKLL